MKEFIFDHARKNWDRYGAFHTSRAPFVEFETGALGLQHAPSHRQRRDYGRYDIQLASTAQDSYPTLYLEKECKTPVPAAWLNQSGQQIIAIDYEQRVAVLAAGSLRYASDAVLRGVPKNLLSLSVLWSQPGQLPLASIPITVSRPDTETQAALRSTLSKVRAAAVAAARMQGMTEFGGFGLGPNTVPRSWIGKSVEEIFADVSAHTHALARTAFRGFTYPRVTEKYEYLWIK